MIRYHPLHSRRHGTGVSPRPTSHVPNRGSTRDTRRFKESRRANVLLDRLGVAGRAPSSLDSFPPGWTPFRFGRQHTLIDELERKAFGPVRVHDLDCGWPLRSGHLDQSTGPLSRRPAPDPVPCDHVPQITRFRSAQWTSSGRELGVGRQKVKPSDPAPRPEGTPPGIRDFFGDPGLPNRN